MGGDKCAYCNCQTFEKNPFSPGKCASCLHNHVKPATSSSTSSHSTTSGHSTSSGNAQSTSSSNLKSFSTPTSLSKSVSQPIGNNNNNSNNNSKVPPGPPPNKSKKPPPVPAAASVSSPNLKDDKSAPAAPPKPQRFASTDNYKPDASSGPAVPAKPVKTTGPPVPGNRPKVNTTTSSPSPSPSPSPSLRSTSSLGAMSVSSPKDDKPKKEGFFSSFKKIFTGYEEEEAALEIGSPVFVKHTTHIGITDRGFETRNLPPDMKKIFEDLDKTLKSMGAKKLSKKEAQFVLNTLLSAMPPGGSTTTQKPTTPTTATPSTPAQQKPAPSTSIAERTQAYNTAAKSSAPLSSTSNTTSAPRASPATYTSSAPPRPPPKTDKPLPSVTQAENKELAKLREQVKTLETEVARGKEQINEQRAKIKNFESDKLAASKASDLASDHQKRVEKLEKENKDLLESIRQEQARASGEIKGKSEMEKQVILLQNEARDATNKQKTAEANIANEEKKRKAAEDELNKAKEKLENLKRVEESRAQLEHEIERLKLQQGATKSEISDKLTASFEKEIKELKSLAAKDLEEATKKFKDLDSEVKKLNQQLQDKTKEKNEFETAISNLKAEKALVAKDASSANEEINRLKSQLDQLRNESGKRAADEKIIQDLKDKNRDLEYQKKELETKSQFFESEKLEFERERKAWEKERKEGEIENKERDAERRERDAERDAWENERESFEEERRRWDDERRRILTEVDRVRSEASKNVPPLELAPPSPAITASAPPPPPMPPAGGPPPPPPPMPTGETKKTYASSSPAPVRKEPQAVAPQGPDTRDALLEAIRNPGKQLKHVRESLIVPKDIDLSTTDPTNIVGILAKALIDRRADIGEDDDEEDGENWDD